MTRFIRSSLLVLSVLSILAAAPSTHAGMWNDEKYAFDLRSYDSPDFLIESPAVAAHPLRLNSSFLLFRLPGSRLTYARAQSVYDRDGDRTESVYRYANDVGTLANPFNVMLFNNVATFGVASGPKSATTYGLTQTLSTKTFDGGPAGTGTSWNTDANWVGDLKPGSGDQALLDNSVLATLPATMTLDAAFTIQSLVLNSANSVIINSNASGTNSRTLTLNGDGSATPVLMNVTGGGSLNLVSSSGTTGSMPVTLGASGQFNVDSGSTLTIGGTVSGTLRSIEKTGTGTLILNGTNTFSGGFTLTNGTFQLGASGAAGTGTLTLAGGTITSSSGTTRTPTNVFSITGDTTFGSTGAGTITFSGGGTTTGPRLLTFNTTTTIFSTNPLTLGGDLTTQGTGGATFSGGIALGGANRIITGGMTGNLTISGGITGTGNVTLDANSAAAVTVSTNPVNNVGTVSNSGTAGGTTTISGGIGANVTGINQTSSTSALTISGGITLGNNLIVASSGTALTTISGGVTGAFNLTLNANTSGNFTLSGTTINNGGTVTNSGSANGTITISAVIGSSVTGVTENSANSTLLLSGQNTYSGATNLTLGNITLGRSSTITAGSLVNGPVGTGIFHIGSGSSATILSTDAGSGTTRTVQNTISLDGDVTFAPGSGQTTGRIALDVFTGLNTANTFSLTRTNQLTVSTGETVDLIGAITGGFGITKLGPGTLNLGNGSATDANANTYTGLTTVSGGLVNLRKASGTDAIAGDLLIDTTGTVALGNSNVIKDTSSLTVNGGGIFDLSGKNEAIDALNGNGTITNNSTLAATASTLTTGSNNGGGTFSGVIQNGTATKTVALTKTGSGILILSGANTYTGDTTIAGGELFLTASGSLAATSTIRLGDTAANSPSAMFTFGSTGGGVSLANPLIVQASASGTEGTRTILGLATNGASNVYSGVVTMNTDLVVQSAAVGGTVANGVGNLIFNGGSIDVRDNTFEMNSNLRGNNADTYSIQGNVTVNEVLSSSLATGGTLVKDGSGSLILQGTSNTYTGTDPGNLNPNGTQIRGGILGIFGDGSLGLAPTNATNNIFFTSSAYNTNVDSIAPTLRANAAGITLAATRNINIASGVTGQFNSNGTTFTIAGNINGAGNLTKIGPGTLALTGANTYTGTTTINAGTLDAATANALGSTSNVTVNSGGTLLFSNNGTIDRINNSASISLNGQGSATASINTAGLSEYTVGSVLPGMGALTLQSSSIIDLSNGASIIAFANSALQSWTVGATLSIYNWSGNILTGNGTDQLYFGTDATGLTVAQLSQISFYSDSGSTFLGVGSWGTDLDGEVVPLAPVPEPSTWIGAALALGAIGFTQLRKRSRADSNAS